MRRYVLLQIMRRYVLLPMLVVVGLAGPSLESAVATPEENLERQFKSLEQKSTQVAESSVSALAKIEAEVVNKVNEDRRRFMAEKDRVWVEALEARKASIVDIEDKRRQLKKDIEIWTSHIDVTGLKEIGDGLGIALAIAEHDNLNVKKLQDIYIRMKELIRSLKYIDLQVSVSAKSMEEETKLASAVTTFSSPFGPTVTGADLEAPRQVTALNCTEK